MQASKKQHHKVIMVLGMARCGTSTIARGLKAVGVNLGNNLHEADERNPKGFWEDNDVTYNINRRLLKEFGYPWIFPDLAVHMRQQDEPVLQRYKQQAATILQERLQQAATWGFKDTNTANLLPFWQSVLREVGAQDAYVISLRNPLGCAYSNIKHSNLELEAGLLAWLKVMILSVQGVIDRPAIIVSYDLLLNDPMRELLRICRDLKLDVTDTEDMDAYASDFVDNNLHHHSFTDEELETHPVMQAVPLCKKVYDLLLQVASDQLTFADAEFNKVWNEIKREFDLLLPLYNYANTVMIENQKLSRTIRRIDRSIIWRFVNPLWRIDEWLRNRRKRVRLSKRIVKAYG